MLHVYRERSAKRTAAEILAQYERSKLVQPAHLDVRRLALVERVALDCAEPFEATDLSPVTPLGTNRILGDIDQNRCVATVRTSEVLADSTTAMALECAVRRRTRSDREREQGRRYYKGLCLSLYATNPGGERSTWAMAGSRTGPRVCSRTRRNG